MQILVLTIVAPVSLVGGFTALLYAALRRYALLAARRVR
jgi:hypothetical protein